jgi:predicted DsbA family dithiol-disulfide isomerase
VKVEVWSDVVCPWCYIGRRRFQAALERFEHRDQVRVTLRSFELDPSAPTGSTETMAQVLAAKYGVGAEQVAAMQARVTEVAAGEDLAYRLDLARPANSFDAHRLLALAGSHGRRDELEERLFAAYFTEGRPIDDPGVLQALAEEVGLSGAEVADVLGGNGFDDEVRLDERTARELGITGVPCFVVDRRAAIAGAESPDRLLALLEQSFAASSDDTGD